MRYPAKHKIATRRRIVSGASAALRARGVAGVGVAELMREAGLTHGGFYAHFPSKDALVAEAVDAAAEQSARNLRKVARRAPAGREFEAIVAAYLSPAHRDRPDRGCALAALGPELARDSLPARQAVARHLDALLDLLQEYMRERPGGSRRRRAIATLSCLVGALLLSRMARDRDVSDEILAAAQRHLTGIAD